MTNTARSHLDAAVGGAFFSLKIKDAKDLIEKMVVNQGWNEEQPQTRKRVTHTIKGIEELSARMDPLMEEMSRL